jgi:hypothetical protein
MKIKPLTDKQQEEIVTAASEALESYDNITLVEMLIYAWEEVGKDHLMKCCIESVGQEVGALIDDLGMNPLIPAIGYTEYQLEDIGLGQ